MRGLAALLALALLPLSSGCFTTRLWSRSPSGSQAHRVEYVYLPFKTAQGDVVVPYKYPRIRSDGVASYVDGRVTLTAEDLAGLEVFVRPSELNRGDVDAILAHEAKLRGTEYPPRDEPTRWEADVAALEARSRESGAVAVLPELYVRRRMKELPWDAAAGREAHRSGLKEQGASQPIEGWRVGSPELESQGGPAAAVGLLPALEPGR